MMSNATTKRPSSLLLARVKAKKADKRTAVGSKAVAEIVRRRRQNLPLVVKGVSQPKRITVSPAQYKNLDVDPSYQRDNVSREVNELVAALQEGGVIPDPISLARRLWTPEDERLYIVDGLQRATAFMQLDMAFNADVFEVQSLADERALFLALNNRVAVSPNKIVKSWPGATGAMLRAVDADPSHPLANRVQYGVGGDRKISAATLARALMYTATGSKHAGGETKRNLAIADTALATDPTAKARCAMMLRLLAHVFPRGYVGTLPVQCFAIIAYEKWQGRAPELPSPRAMANLAKINWAAQVPSFATRFRPVLLEIIRRHWKD